MSPSYRPQIHFSPPFGWMNDPNGLVFHNELWHLFYQFHPQSLTFGPMHWGHAVSKDLIKWEHWAVALEPDVLGNIWSGSAAVTDQNEIVACFTQQNQERQAQSLAFSRDGGHTFEKYAGNPVLNSDRRDFRDPKIFRYGKEWRMIVAAGADAQIFASTNLKEWSLLSQLPAPKGGWIWECPDLFLLEGKWVLIASFVIPHQPHETYHWLGDFDGVTFVPEGTPQRLSFGPDDYAAVSWSDAPDQRRVIIGWMSRWDYAAQLPTERDGFRGAMTLPRELSLRDGKLLQNPVREIENYRGVPVAVTEESVGVEAGCFEIEATLEIATAWRDPVGFSIGNADEHTDIYVGVGKDEVRIDRTHSGIAVTPRFADSFGDVFTHPMPQQITLRIFVDRCSVEVFVNGGEIYGAALIFPTSTQRKVTFLSGGAKLLHGFIYPLLKQFRQ